VAFALGPEEAAIAAARGRGLARDSEAARAVARSERVRVALEAADRENKDER
jgi:hypothetical protein